MSTVYFGGRWAETYSMGPGNPPPLPPPGREAWPGGWSGLSAHQAALRLSQRGEPSPAGGGCGVDNGALASCEEILEHSLAINSLASNWHFRLEQLSQTPLKAVMAWGCQNIRKASREISVAGGPGVPVCSSSCPSTSQPDPPPRWQPGHHWRERALSFRRTQQGREQVLPCPGQQPQESL